MADLRVRLAGLELQSPVLLAAGTAGYLDELEGPVDFGAVGAVVSKSITRHPREGNPTWRILPARAGMLNAIGLANVGIERFVEHTAPRIDAFQRRTGCRVIGSVAGFSIDDYVQVCAHMEQIEAIGAVELNVSCPNVHGGVEFGADPAALRELVGAVRAALPTTALIVKLSPIAVGHPGIERIAEAAVAGGAPGGRAGRPGADGLTLCNTIPAMAIDIHTRRPRLTNVTGGLSGPAVHPVAVGLTHRVYRAVARDAGVPLIGAGGVSSWTDAAEFILAGASAIEIGSALFADPRAPRRVRRGLARWARGQGAGRLTDLVGAVDLEPHAKET
ncbi:MAG: dihydroorotate dehydrogenase [Phycisphaerales bacterium JB039]